MRAPSAICAVMAIAVLAVGSPASGQQDETPPGEELYIDRLGCSGCHGRSGEGGTGPALHQTGLPLWLFTKQVRLPREVMPPFRDILMGDSAMVVIYDWLDGVDPVVSPPPVRLSVEGFQSMEAGVDTEATFTAAVRDSAEASGAVAEIPDGAPGERTRTAAAVPLRYRITLMARDGTPAADRPLEHRLAGEGPWTSVRTDGLGQAMLGPDDGFTLDALSDGPVPEVTTDLRVALPSGTYTFVVEALDWSDPDRPTALGIGTEVFEVE